MAAINITFAVFLYGLCMYAEQMVGDLAGRTVGALTLWPAAAYVIQVAWTNSGSVWAPLWHTLLVAGVLGLTAAYAPTILATSAAVPTPIGQMHLFVVFGAAPLIVAGGPAFRWALYR